MATLKVEFHTTVERFQHLKRKPRFQLMCDIWGEHSFSSHISEDVANASLGFLSLNRPVCR